MEMPLVFRDKADGSLVYSISALFRAAMGLILAILAAALFMDGGSPGVGGWIALALAGFGALYEERWTFDKKSGEIAHRVGLVFVARRRKIAMIDVMSFRIVPFVRGTLPGSADEIAQNAAALAGKRADDGARRRAPYKKPYLCIVCETADGSSYFIDALSARKADKLKARASRIAAACGKKLIEAY
jgi:hypothetical protein